MKHTRSYIEFCSKIYTCKQITVSKSDVFFLYSQRIVFLEAKLNSIEQKVRRITAGVVHDVAILNPHYSELSSLKCYVFMCSL